MSISELISNPRFLFVIAASRILEGTRVYGEQALATPTLQRLHVLRGVVNMVVVSVTCKVQGAKNTFVAKDRAVVQNPPDADVRTTNNI